MMVALAAPDCIGFVAVGERPLGVIAIGGAATGIVAIGGSATGIVAIGGFARGVFAIGFLAIGFLAVGLPFALGGTAYGCGFALGGRVRGAGLGVGLDNEVIGGGPSWEVAPYPVGYQELVRGWWAKTLFQTFIVAMLVATGWFGPWMIDQWSDGWAEVALGVATGLLTWLALPVLFSRQHKQALEAARFASARAAKRTATGVATIKTLERTGLSINDQPQIQFELHLDLGANEGIVCARRVVDIVDIPRLQPGCKFPVHYDPDDADNIEIDFEGKLDEVAAATPPDEESLNLKGVESDSPLWTYGMKDPSSWLLPTKASDAPRVCVFDFGQLGNEGTTERGGLSLLLAEMLWMQTNARATAIGFLQPEQRVRAQLLRAYTFDEIKGALADHSDIAVYGTIAASGDSISLTVRLVGDQLERTFKGALVDLIPEVMGWMTAKGFVKAETAPAWYSLPPDCLRDYAALLGRIQFQIWADREKNALIQPLSADEHAATVDSATRLLERCDSEPMQLAFLTAHNYAHRSSALDEEAIRRVRDLLQTAVSGSPCQLLSAYLLPVFGATPAERASEACLSADGPYRTQADPYRDWLSRLNK